MLRKCCVCHEEKDLSNFSGRKDRPHGKSYRCKECDAKAHREYRKNNLEHVRKIQRDYDKNNTEKRNKYRKKYYSKHRKSILEKAKESYKKDLRQRFYWLSKETGISVDNIVEWYNKQWMKQQAQCSICTNVFSENDVVHHCHKTNKLISILCDSCNNGIGKLRDSAELCRKAAEYLEKYKS